MNWELVAALTAVVAAIMGYEWPKIDRELKKERRTFVALTVLGWFLGTLLIFKPDLPGPSQFIDRMFHPLVTLIERTKG